MVLVYKQNYLSVGRWHDNWTADTSMGRCLPTITGWAELWPWLHCLGSVSFLSKTKLKMEEMANYFHLEMSVDIHSKFKTKR